VSDVHGRTVGVWTLLSCTLCFLCAFNLDNKPLCLATFLSFVYGYGYFVVEYLVYHSVGASTHRARHLRRYTPRFSLNTFHALFSESPHITSPFTVRSKTVRNHGRIDSINSYSVSIYIYISTVWGSYPALIPHPRAPPTSSGVKKGRTAPVNRIFWAYAFHFLFRRFR
jgi:hypothetical protein